MKLLVLPPHRDVTLAPDVPEGWQVLDVARAFCRRVFSWDGEEGHAALRALDSVLRELSGPPSSVRLRLDDLRLDGGTLERSADVLRAASRPAPYTEDLALALERISDAERVRLWLEDAAQLPAAVWLARACPATVPLELAGPYAHAHRKVLSRMNAFNRATFPLDVAPLRWRVVPLHAEPTPESLVWIPEWLGLELVTPPRREITPSIPGIDTTFTIDWMMLEAPHPRTAPGRDSGHLLGRVTPARIREFTGGAPWAGHVTIGSALSDVGALAESGCRLAVVPFCARKDGELRTLDGWVRWWPNLQHHWKAGVKVVAEWWVGAPGVSEETLRGTLDQLAAVPLMPFCDWVAGVHRFQAGAGRRSPDVHEYGDPNPRHDLALSRSVTAPGTVPPERLPALIDELAGQLDRRAPLSPGRVAGAYLHIPDTTPFGTLPSSPDNA